MVFFASSIPVTPDIYLNNPVHFVALAVPTEKLPDADYLQYLSEVTGYEILECVRNVSSAASLPPGHGSDWAVIFAVDVMPLPSRGDVENPRIFSIHKRFRKITKDGTIVFSKNQEQARHVAAALLSDAQCREIFSRCRSLEDEYKTNDEVVKVLSNGSRAKVEVIRKNGKSYVRKTSRSGHHARLNREINARTELSHINEISPLIESGVNYFVIPYYQSHIGWTANPLSPLPVELARAVVVAIRKIWENGWVLLDNDPTNFLFFADGSVKVIDLEQALLHDEMESEFKNSYFFASQWPEKYREVIWPRESKEPRPLRYRTWQKIWRPIVGLDYDEIFMPQNTLLNIKRHVSVFGNNTPHFLAKIARNRIRARRRDHLRVDDRWIYLPL